MRIALALVVFTLSVPAIAEETSSDTKPTRMPIVCRKSAEHVAGLNKICHYSCAKSDGTMTVPPYEACPQWTPRWRLSRTAHSESAGTSRQ
ncbi:hypothetical protein SAMN05444171_4814 [Bradyrhizobium lablabi]|uniref:DUF3551 domain-containing protein n=2 Tax=Bradyrhizobium TaxID=374 RepID=A0ABY0PFG6_9BRAD|nr:hypothetical protein SAMN05444163_2352 [Bradyrhizobium ottawaense]SED68629.1 hypothetical protein SAMN05444171_4814 [Bradyrhizobium lablabi]SHL65299.1 hypothetical protein SAMN05444321_3631 [Bradyrhizobium lablabi]